MLLVTTLLSLAVMSAEILDTVIWPSKQRLLCHTLPCGETKQPFSVTDSHETSRQNVSIPKSPVPRSCVVLCLSTTLRPMSPKLRLKYGLELASVLRPLWKHSQLPEGKGAAFFTQDSTVQYPSARKHVKNSRSVDEPGFLGYYKVGLKSCWRISSLLKWSTVTVLLLLTCVTLCWVLCWSSL